MNPQVRRINPEAILLRNESFIWLSSWLVLLIVIIEQRKMNGAQIYYGKKCQKHTYSPPQKNFNWLIGRRPKTISSKCCMFVRVGGLLTRQNILKKKKHRSNLSIIDGVVVGISADSYTAFFSYFSSYNVYLQTVDWKKHSFKVNLLYFVITRTIRSFKPM